jgi:transposase
MEWHERGVWHRLWQSVLSELQAQGHLDWERRVIDSATVRAGHGGEKTGKNPMDRSKLGSKHHLLVEGGDVPLAIRLTGANRHNVTQLLALVESIPRVRGRRGHPRQKPKRLQGDRAYDSEPHRRVLKKKGVKPVLAKRYTAHGSGLGRTRWVVERSLSWLHQFRKLRMREETLASTHEALMLLACAIVAHRHLKS